MKVVKSLKKSTEPKPAIDTTRVILNIPTKLLEEFDKICAMQSYQRAEGIKEAMRSFINVESDNMEAWSGKINDTEKMKEFLKFVLETANESKKK